MQDDFRNYVDGLMRGDALAGVKAAVALEGVIPETRYAAICRRRDGSIRWDAKAKNRVTTVGLNKLLDATFKTGLASPAWYVGLVAQSITDAAITASAAVLTSASNPFSANDVGRNIIVRGAGASGADLLTTILSFTNSGSVTLNTNAGTTVTAARAVWECRLADTMASHSPWSTQTGFSNANRPAFTPGSIASGSVDNSGSPAVFNINADNTNIGGLLLIDDSTVGGTTGTLYGMAVWTTGGFRQAYNGDTVTVTGTLTMTAT